MVEQSTDIPQGSYYFLLGNGFHPQVNSFAFYRSSQLQVPFRQGISAHSRCKESRRPLHLESWLKRFKGFKFITDHPMVVVDVDAAAVGGRTIRELTPGMIRRMDEPPKPINSSGSSSGWVSERRPSCRTIPPRSERSFTSTQKFSKEFPSNTNKARLFLISSFWYTIR